MSWQAYVDNLMADGSCQEAAIIGCAENKSVWASCSGGSLANVTEDEIKALTAKERDSIFTNGLVLGKKKCSVIRDSLAVEGDCTMDIRTKSEDGGPTYNVSVGKAEKAMVVLMGKEGIHGGNLNKKAFEMADYLRKSGY